MKVSVSVPPKDVEFLGAYAETVGMASAPLSLDKAVRLPRAP